jgi:urea transport system ATP-binding protein
MRFEKGPQWPNRTLALPAKTIDLSHDEILYIEDLHVSFDGFQAITGLNLYLQPGELRCVIGPNGAGKTTLMDVVTGKTGPRNAKVSGTVYLGQTINLLKHTESEIAQMGIGRKFQKPTLFDALAVWENLQIAHKENKSWIYSLRLGLTTALESEIADCLNTVGLTEKALRLAGELSHGEKQRLEIGMLLMQKPDLLLLDEPAAGMSDTETAHLAQLLNRLRGTCSMMVVEHDMGFVQSLSGDHGKVTVLSEGRVLSEGTMARVKADPAVIESYLGR